MGLKGLQVALVVAGLTFATEVRAQGRVAFEELAQVVKPGQVVAVRGSDGRTVTGKLVSTSARAIVIARPRSFFRTEVQTIQAGSISRISRADSRVNGAMLGLAVGVGAAVAMVSTDPDGPGAAVVAPGAFVALLGSIGAGVGMALDGAFKPTIYESSGPGAIVRLAPLMRGGRRGILASIRF